jgi:diaminohydroxyphosphoribosylaminopyrimidine deaminase/5-amino-6-(5-phosphoribosylamino)uracil reductase
MSHEHYMQRCLQLAALGAYTAAPNPMVGCVVVHNDSIIGEGWHHSAGKPHAEVNALAAVKNPALLKEATVYVSLEPCAHFGRTPPCADLLVEKQVKKVVIGCQDPFAKVNGAGIQKLRAAGIAVETGILEEACRALNQHFFTFHEKKRPFVSLKWAQSQNGFFDLERSTETRIPNWITGPEAKTYVHHLRAQHAAILVGSKTVLADNPSLSTRLVKGPSPMRLVLDRGGILPKESTVFTDGAPTVVFGKGNSSDGHIRYIPTGEKPLQAILDYCYAEGYTSLFVEGGATLLQHFIQEKLWDEAHVLIGTPYFATGIPAPNLELAPVSSMQLGQDVCLKFTAP